ncbi:MAG: sensor histidine kinase [Pseudobacter sp.]|uniref:sensor histidine kinase n=1 Tax=Pseudobacter sp. TaxID=2045420 RepID=UPI003F7F631A
MAAFSNRIIRNITSGELLCWLLYLVFWASCNWIDAGIKIALTIPLWWFYFVTLKNTRLQQKLLLHIITLPAFCITWYLLCRQLNTSFQFNSPFWDIYLTALFYCCQFIIFHLYNHWLRSRKRKQQEQERLEYAYQYEISSLKTQIGPHFLFNTLNSISATIPPANEETRVLISQLADTFRYALNIHERPTVPLKDEIEFVRNWLALEKQRLGNRLQLIYDIEPATLDTTVPAMILHPLLENALSNSINRQLQGGTITISSIQEGNDIRIYITDMVAVFTNPLQSMLNRSHTLSNASRRLEKLFGEPLSISYNHNGMTVSFRVPGSVHTSSTPAVLPLTALATQ